MDLSHTKDPSLAMPISKRSIAAILLLVAIPPCAPAFTDSDAPLDLVFLIEDSRRMLDRLSPSDLLQTGNRFLASIPEGNRVSVISFNDATSLLESPESQAPALVETGPEALSFRSEHSNPAAGVERAIDKLKAPDAEHGRQAIVILGSGVLEVGDPQQNQRYRRWLGEILASEAARASISVTPILMGEDSDPVYTQLAERTGGHLEKDAAPALDAALARVAGRLFGVTVASADVSLAATPSPAPDTADAPATQSAAATQQTNATIPGEPDRGDTRQQPGPAPILVPDATAPDAATLPFTLPWMKQNQVAVLVIGALALLVLILTVMSIRRSRPQPAAVPPEDDHVQEPHVRLAQLEDLARGRSHDISGKLTWISRVPGERSRNVTTVAIKDDSISREHAVIQYRDQGYWLSDRGSRNGTFVNDQRLTGERLLKSGDRLRFAKFEFEFALAQRPDLEETRVFNPADDQERTAAFFAARSATTTGDGDEPDSGIPAAGQSPAARPAEQEAPRQREPSARAGVQDRTQAKQPRRATTAEDATRARPVAPAADPEQRTVVRAAKSERVADATRVRPAGAANPGADATRVRPTSPKQAADDATVARPSVPPRNDG